MSILWLAISLIYSFLFILLGIISSPYTNDLVGGIIKRIYFIIIETSLELIPKHLLHEPKIIKIARKLGKSPNNMLLEVSYHRMFIKKLPYSEKRGRPDILHTTLLYIFDSPINREGYLNVYVHTINDEVFWFNPKIRIPKTYQRFKGLMVQLLKKSIIISDSGEILIKKEDISIDDLISKINGPVFLFSEKGAFKPPTLIAKELLEYENPCILIGGFPHGDFSRRFYEAANNVYSIDPEPLATWTVASKIITSIENEINLSEKRFKKIRKSQSD
ncbi:MAG: 16S rRNA methyltransferase [Candidatus Asgardarchaeum sp.]